MIEGLSHITFIVSDLERTSRLFVEGLGATQIYNSGDEHFSHSAEMFFKLGGLWIAIMEGAPLKERSYNHTAFYVDDSLLDQYRTRLQQLGATVLPDRKRVKGEGRSIYFYDYDNHLFELHSGTLEQRLKSYANS